MQRNFNSLKNQSFDVLVCGGGIYGAWTAYDAALRGLKVAIVDKNDWAGATSSASSKLIHGGLRYLETLDFKLVRKSLEERSMLLTTAPHRVWPLRFGIPVYESNRLGKIKLKIGLTLYDFLAGKLSRSIKHRYHSQKEFTNRFPSLKSSKLKGGFTYADAQTDDARFVLELIDGACSAGAVCVNYCEVVNFEEKHGKLSGAVLFDRVNDAAVTIEVSQVVDAMGRYSPLVQPDRNICRLTKGIHLIMPSILMDEALLLTAKSDGRVFFAIPWYGLTLLGTTDTNYVGDNDNVRIHNEDIHYLLSEANQVFDVNWTERDIIGKFAGIRVLQQSQQDNPTKITRDWDLRISENGLLSSIGGKFTSAREDAAIIVDKLCANLGVQAKCQTFGKTFPWLSDIDYLSLVTTSLSKAEHLGIDAESALWIVKRHGQRSASVFQLCEENPALASRIRTELPFILADLVFCACHENVIHLDDLLRRRMPLLILAKILPEEMSHLAEITAKALAWDSEKTEAEITRCLQIQAALEE
jgi:glycerol-3-phosphate dehydrogenase